MVRVNFRHFHSVVVNKLDINDLLVGIQGFKIAGTLTPVSVWLSSNKTQMTRVTAHIVAFSM